jgi:transaldolase
MAQTTKTQFWNDSCSIPELLYALEHGAVGATTNPVIVGQVLRQELDAYAPRIRELIRDNPNATEDEVAWLLNEIMAVEGAQLLESVFDRTRGRAGYISIQVNAKYYKKTEKIVEQALHFKSLAPNIMVKIPVTTAGLRAIEECVYRGVNVNATVSFTVAQALAVGSVIEEALIRRKKEGLSNEALHPVCTIMAGRIEDWLREVANSTGIVITPPALDYSGVAVVKRAYEIYMEKCFATHILVAAYRNHLHWSEFIGGDVSLTIPHKWIKCFVKSDITVKPRMDYPVDTAIIAHLKKHLVDFSRAYEPDGMTPEEFDSFGATRNTLTQFLAGYDDMLKIIRDFMVNG